MKKTVMLLGFIWAVAFWPSVSFSQSQLPSRYDLKFRQAAGWYMPGVDWRLLKAQCWQESRLVPDAVSPVGAQGLCQFMPGTWAGIIGPAKLPPDASAFAPRLSIEAAAFYMGKLRAEWSSPRPEWDRHSLALASYNAGLGHLLTAQRKCNGAVLYDRIIACLPDVTGRHSKETIGYVTSIWGWYEKIKAGW